MKLRVGLAGLLLTILACADLAGPTGRPVAFSILPVFDANGFLVSSNADQLRIRVQRDSSGTFVTVKDTTVAIDADGNAAADVNVVLLQSPQVFRVLLDAARSSDGAVLFSGSQTVTVTSGTGGTPQAVQIPVSYSGPHGASVVMAPKDSVVTAGGSFSFRATVFDSSSRTVADPVGFYLVNRADSTKLTLNRLTGRATAITGQQGQVGVYALSADSLRDTTSVTITLTPAVGGARVTPGYGTVGAGQSLQFAGTLLGIDGNPVSGGTFTWTSRSPAVAGVDASGRVTGVAPGSAIITAVSGTYADSVLVTVPASGRVVVSALGDGRSFRAPAVGDMVELDVTADMRLTTEKLGSYNARMTWDPSHVAFVDVAPALAGDFSSPVVNSDSAAAGVLRFATADPTGAGGTPVLGRFHFRAALSGSSGLVLSITEMSGSVTFTSLSSLVTVTNGNVTVR